MGTDKRSRKKENRQKRLNELARANKRRRTQRNVVRIFIVIAIVVSVAGIFSVTGGDQSAETPTTTSAPAETATTIAPVEGRTISGDTPCPAVDGSEERAGQFEKAPPTCIEDGATYLAIVSTN